MTVKTIIEVPYSLIRYILFSYYIESKGWIYTATRRVETYSSWEARRGYITKVFNLCR